jgi:addiction module RelE/StbE family toxin
VNYQIGTTPRFKRRLRKFTRSHPDLRPRIAQLLRALQEDPFQPHLRLHQLSGEFAGLHAVSLMHSYRVLLTLYADERRIVLVDVGSHDEVYR